ncbi:InlB B-repeat-containing protein [Methanorbis rubei]|uniref:Uncharacterized protein n=1 Tax=Methanorbis rubei TaxID=3028300 RepID=A0AAE4MIV2_9EURY|nr:hypothetical protein [Methanocorpusculaceae archaeon Cs1]
MLLRTCGTQCPKTEAGELGRGGVLAVKAPERREDPDRTMAAAAASEGKNTTKYLWLATTSLLLIFLLMAGAVSAEGWNVVTTAEELRSNLTVGNNVTLGDSFTDAGTSSLIIENANPVLDLNGKTLTFSGITNSALVIGNDTANKKGSLTIQDSLGNGGIKVPNGYLFFVRNASTLTLNAGSFEAKYFVVSTNANGEWNDPTITIGQDVTLTTPDTAIYIPAQGSNVTITGAKINGGLGGVCVASGNVTITDTEITVSGQSSPRWNDVDGSADDGSAVVVQKKSAAYKGDVNLKLLGNTVVDGPTADALHNYIRKNPDDPGKTTVTIADTVRFNGALRSYQYGTATSDIGGIFQNESGEILLYPGLSQDGVAWGGDAVNGWTLTISKSGSYKLMESFDYAPYTSANRLSITNDVTLDLNGHTITAQRASSAGDTAFISVSEKTLTINGNGGGISTSGTSSDGFKSCLFLAGKNSTLTINSGTFSSNGIVISENGAVSPSYANPTIILNGGTFTSSNSTAVYMTADDGTLTVADGVAITGKTAGIEIRSGKAEITGGKIHATGSNNYPPLSAVPANPISDGSAIVLVSKPDAYTADIELTVGGTSTELISTNGAAIRNYVRNGDGKGGIKASNDTINVIVSDTAKLSGKTAVIENTHYSGDTTPVVGTFNLNGGYYKCTDAAAGVLLKDVTPTYLANHIMSDTPVMDGYYGIISVEPIHSPGGTVNDACGCIDVSAGDIELIGNTVNITVPEISGVVAVNFTLTYPGGVEVYGNQIQPNVSGEIPKVEMIYSPVSLRVFEVGRFYLTVEGNPTGAENLSRLLNGTAIPFISTEINDEARDKLPTTAVYIGMVTVDYTNYSRYVGTPTLLMTFGILDVGEFEGMDYRKIFVFHVDKDGKVTKIPTTQSYHGNDWYTFTATFTDASPLILAYDPSGGPGPVPPGPSDSSDGNMENAFRVLFDSKGGSFVQPATYLSYGDRVPKPSEPTKDGYTFSGWHKDEACTILWIFSEDAIPGDMTLYAKWISTATPVVTPSVEPTTEPPVPTMQPTAAPTITDVTISPPIEIDDDSKSGTENNGVFFIILLLLLLFLLFLIYLLRHTVIFLVHTAEGIEKYRIRIWHGKKIDPKKLPELLRTADWYLDKEHSNRWDMKEDRVTRNITLYH